MRVVLLAAFTALSLSAQSFNYVCEDDYRFSATLIGKNLKIKLARQSVLLKPVASASGSKYSDGKITLHNKNDQALLYLDDFIPFHCQSDFKLPEPKRQPILKTAPVLEIPKKTAKFERKAKQKIQTKKSIFVASGHNPEWELRVSKKSGHLLYDEGKAFNFRLPKGRQSGDSILYFYRGKKTRMLIELHNHHCFDSLSKKEHSTTVSIKMNGRNFVGCGQ